MTLSNSRIWLRLRARSIKRVKVYNKRSFNNLSCRFCDDNIEETQEHLEGCRGCEFERRNFTMRHWKGRVIFWRRMTTKISARGEGDDVAAVAGGHINMEARVVE